MPTSPSVITRVSIASLVTRHSPSLLVTEERGGARAVRTAPRARDKARNNARGDNVAGTGGATLVGRDWSEGAREIFVELPRGECFLGKTILGFNTTLDPTLDPLKAVVAISFARVAPLVTYVSPQKLSTAPV